MRRSSNDEWPPLMKAVALNLGMLAIWYLSEYAQFGELQMDRQCDDLVFTLYFLMTWALFRCLDKKNRRDDDVP